MTRKEDREAGKVWVRSLSMTEVGELGNEFVLGTFDWREWLPRWGIEHKPSAAFLLGADEERIRREEIEQ